MNDLYIHNLEVENKQLRIALQECRKALEEEITTKKQAIEYIKEHYNLATKEEGVAFFILRDNLLDILGEKEND